MRIASIIGLGLAVGCRGSRSDQTAGPVGGTHRSERLGLTLTFPDGWSTVPTSESASHMIMAQFIRDRGPTPAEIILFAIAEQPSTDESFEKMQELDERVFDDVISEHQGATRAGACERVPGTAIDRCLGHSSAPLARTLVDYTWVIEHKHAGMRVMSASTDELAVTSEADAIARSAH